TIDPLSVFFWAATAYVFWRTRHSDTIALWIGVGLLIGIGALAKYTNLALIPSLALYLLLTPPLRRHLIRGTFWAMIAAALLCLVPVAIWNYRHDWITIAHLLNRGALDRPWRFSPGELLAFLGGQAAVYFPPFFAGLTIGIFTGGPRDASKADPGAFAYLLCLFAPLFLFYLVLAVNSSGEANWTAPAFIGGVILLTATWYHRSRTSRPAAVASRWSLGLAAAFTVAFLAAVDVRLPTERDPFYRIHGWRSLAGQVADAAAEHNVTFIIGDGYQTASLLSFYLDGGYSVFDIRTPGIANQFSFWPSYTESFTGKDAVFVSTSATPHRLLRAQFESVGPALEAPALHRGNPVRPFYLHVCRNLTRHGGD
ncbi:MAG: glycosyltransferase family 39 protein, partial [bacterium]